MTIDWTESGYPLKHFDEIRAAKRYAIRAIAITGTTFASLLAGTIFGPVSPLATATAGAVFLMFGLFGGLGSLYDTCHYVQVILYFERSLGEIDTFLAGNTMVRVMKQLDAIATEENVQPLSTFGFADDIRGEDLHWHDPVNGLQSIEAILQRLAESEVPTAILKPLRDDLNKWKHALERAASEIVLFCILVRHGNSTSGQEWDVRKGSAF